MVTGSRKFPYHFCKKGNLSPKTTYSWNFCSKIQNLPSLIFFYLTDIVCQCYHDVLVTVARNKSCLFRSVKELS